MRSIRLLSPLWLLLVAFPACTSSSARAPALESASQAAVTAGDPDDLGAAKYAVCGGQGANPAQLAPAFVDRMGSCESADTAPADGLVALAGDGEIVEGKGDCRYQHGIGCHFHTSMEFVSTTRLKDDEHAVGELHCIVPSAHPNSPTVYGAHLRCKPGTSPAAGARSCSSELLRALDTAHCKDGWRCCDNGTLTKPIGKQDAAERKLHPDFRICQDDSIEVDCGLLHGMHGHTANVAGLGEETTGKFCPAGEHGEPSSHH